VARETAAENPRSTDAPGETAGAAALPVDHAGPVAERQTTPFLVLQFFVFPMSIVAVCVAVFVVFGLIASEGKGAREYLDEVRTGSTNRRWQAAFELSKLLQAGKDPTLTEPRFGEQVIAAFQEAADDDPRVRRYLALAIGRIGDTRAVPALLAAVRQPAPGAQGTDAETRIYAVWALGVLGDSAAVPDLALLTSADDAGVRKAAVHALGSFRSPEASAALTRALDDPVADVRWNAALALARRGDAAAAPTLLEMTDRSRLAGVAELRPDQLEDVMLQAVAAAASLPQPGLRDALESLRERDPSLRVREAAGRALLGEPPPAPNP
jgi:HEAT repeat protein